MLGQLLWEEASRQSEQRPRSSELWESMHNWEDNGDSSIIEIRPDPQRERRKGVPEVIFGETKEVAQIIAMAQVLLDGSGRAIISRIHPEAVAAIEAAVQGCTVRVRGASRSVVIYKPDYVRRRTGGRVGVISAG